MVILPKLMILLLTVSASDRLLKLEKNAKDGWEVVKKGQFVCTSDRGSVMQTDVSGRGCAMSLDVISECVSQCEKHCTGSRFAELFGSQCACFDNCSPIDFPSPATWVILQDSRWVPEGRRSLSSGTLSNLPEGIPECAIHGSEYWSPNPVADAMPSTSASDCQRTCQSISECAYWVYNGWCHFHGAEAIFGTNEHTQNSNYVTGPQFCDNDWLVYGEGRCEADAFPLSVPAPEGFVFDGEFSPAGNMYHLTRTTLEECAELCLDVEWCEFFSWKTESITSADTAWCYISADCNLVNSDNNGYDNDSWKYTTYIVQRNSARKYVTATALNKCSAEGLASITTAEECEAAANALGIKWNGCCQNISNEPYGCQHRIPDGDILFNGNANSPTQFSGKSNREEVCSTDSTEEYIKHEKSQCQANFAPYNGDRLDNPIFNGGGFIGQMTGSECAAECTNPANVDGFGRPCVAFEHSSQDYDSVANCALAWACDYTEKWSGGAAYIRAYMNLPSDYALAASDVCVSAVDVDGTLFDVLYTGNVDSTKLVHTSGSVTCNVNTPNRYSNWGCTPGDQNLAIRLLADDAQTRKFPSSGTEGLTENTEVGTWYKLEGHDSSSDSLTIHGPSQTILHRYRAVYSDALPVWNSDHDNGGEVCFDVFMKASAAFVKHGHSQCVSNNAPFDGDRLDNPIFGGGGFIGKMTGAECEAQCIDPTNVDEHGRPCVAFEHSHSQYTAVANCALAWACDYTKAWSGGTVYSRAHRN